MPNQPTLDRRFSVAPMMEWTDRHFRYFARLLSRHALLYTEMVTTGALLYGDKARHLDFSAEEHPIALQLGGSHPDQLAECCRLAENWGYDEVNLNVGCPSDRVQNNMIGACLMAHADLVTECLSRMQAACSIPVTIKHRIGIDDHESFDYLYQFVDKVRQSGCRTFIVHARVAKLQGLSPKQNREIPPLKYDYVYQLKQAFPELEIIINGGIETLPDMQSHLTQVDGVMVGRAAYHNPWLLAHVDQQIYQQAETVTPSRHDVIRSLYSYIEHRLSQGDKLTYITRHILGLFHEQPGGKRFRRHLSTHAHLPKAGLEVLEQALALVPEQNAFGLDDL